MKSFNSFNRVPNGPRVARNMLIATVCVLSFTTTTASAQAVKLELKYKPGDKFVVQSKEKIQQRFTLGGNDDVTMIEGAATRLIETGKPNAKGEFRRVHSVQLMTRTISKGSGDPRMTFDSRKPNATDASGFPGGDVMISALKARSKAKIFYVYDKSHQLLSAGIEGIASDQLPDALKSEMNPAKLKLARTQEVQAMPTKPVMPGDSWEHKSDMSLGAGQTLKLVTKYTYRGTKKRGDREFDFIETIVLKADLTAEEAPAGLPQLTESNIRPGKSTSQIWFDREAGRIAASKERLQITGDVTLSFQGQSINAELDFAVDSEMEVKPAKTE